MRASETIGRLEIEFEPTSQHARLRGDEEHAIRRRREAARSAASIRT